MIDIQIGSSSFFDSSEEIWFSNSSIFGMCGLFFMQLSLSFRASNALFYRNYNGGYEAVFFNCF